MRNLRGIFNSMSPAGLLIPLVLSALLIAQGTSLMTREIDAAKCGLDDWRAALEAFENGAVDFQGRCVGASIGAPGQDFSWVDEQIQAAEVAYDAAVASVLADPWKLAADSVGGIALVFFALFVGGMASGSPLGSVVAAWGLSNGWTRRAWARSTLTLTTFATLAAYVVALLAVMALLYARLSSLGIDFGLAAPSLEALHPIPGLLYFGMLGVLSGMIVGRGEMGGLVAVVVAIADFMLSARFGVSQWFPTTWHQTAVGTATVPMSLPLAMGLAAGAAVVLALVGYLFFTRRRDVPDR